MTEPFETPYGFDGVSRHRMIFSIRMLKFFLVWLMGWQESGVMGSPFQLDQIGINLPALRTTESILVYFAVVLLIERTLTGDYTLKRSYFYGPLFLIAFALFLSWARGAYISQSVRLVYESHEAFRILPTFALMLNGFREEGDGRRLLIVMLLAGIAKSFDGLYLFLFSKDKNIGWGTIQLWRDGYVVTLLIIAGVLVTHYKGRKYAWLRKVLIYSTPLALFVLITGLRRTFIVALAVSLFCMFVSLGRGRRLRHGGMFFSLLLLFAVAVLLSNPIAFLERFSGVVDPSGEGSAYIRLMEYPNVLMNIKHNPIFGTAIGIGWHQYYRMPVYANFTQIGTHNTYLYWPLRAGILGSIGFLWFLARMWKPVLLQLRLMRTEEEFFFAQLSLYIIVLYQMGCFFGIMAGDAMPPITAMTLVAFQLEFSERFGLLSLKRVDLIRSLLQKRIVMRPIPALLPVPE